MNNSTSIYRRVGHSLFLSSLLLLQNCGGGSEKSEPLAVTRAESTAPTVGVKNFRQLDGSLRAVLGVTAVADEIRGILKRLPMDGKADKVSSSSLLATVQLVGTYCEQFIAAEVRLKPGRVACMGKWISFHPSVNFPLLLGSQWLRSTPRCFGSVCSPKWKSRSY
jgi:hypothetical protein